MSDTWAAEGRRTIVAIVFAMASIVVLFWGELAVNSDELVGE